MYIKMVSNSSGFWKKWWNIKNLMDTDENNSLVWTCDLFDIEQYNKEKKYIQLVEPSRIFVPVTNTQPVFPTPYAVFFIYCSIVWCGCSFCWYWWNCSGRVSNSCTTSDTRVNLVTNPVISREWGKDREVFTTSGKYPGSFVTQIFHNG